MGVRCNWTGVAVAIDGMAGAGQGIICPSCAQFRSLSAKILANKTSDHFFSRIRQIGGFWAESGLSIKPLLVYNHCHLLLQNQHVSFVHSAYKTSFIVLCLIQNKDSIGTIEKSINLISRDKFATIINASNV